MVIKLVYFIDINNLLILHIIIQEVFEDSSDSDYTFEEQVNNFSGLCFDFTGRLFIIPNLFFFPSANSRSGTNIRCKFQLYFRYFIISNIYKQNHCPKVLRDINNCYYFTYKLNIHHL